MKKSIEEIKETGRYALLSAMVCTCIFALLCEVDEGAGNWTSLFACTKGAGILLAAATAFLASRWASRGKLPRLRRYLEDEP